MPIDFSAPFKLDLDFTDADAQKAKELQAHGFSRFTNDQVNWSARRTLDKVEASLSSSSSSYASSSSSSIQQASRDAMNQLKNTLQALRSHQKSQFQESVAPSTTESRIRVNLGVDSVGNINANSGTKKAAITANIRPLNDEAFKIYRDRFCNTAKIAPKNESGVVEAFGQIKLKLKPGASQADKDDFVALVTKCAPQASDADSDEEAGYQAHIEGDILYLTAAFHDDDPDPLQKILMKIAASTLDTYRGDEEAEAAANEAPGLFRLATARVELPHSLSEWLETNEASWIKLIEGARVAFEAIVRQDCHRVVHQHLAKELTGSFDKGDLVSKILTPFGQIFARDTSLNINAAPFELLYALLVKEGAFLVRRMKETAEVPATIKRLKGDDAATFYSRFFDTTSPEDLVAAFASLKLFFGITSTKIKERILSEMARPLIDGSEDDDVDTSLIGQISPLLTKIVGEVLEFNLTGHSFQLKLDFEGFDENLWRFFPSSPQDLINAVKPIAMAGFDDLDDEDSRDKKLEEGACRIRKYWPRGAFEDKAEEVANKLAPGEYMDSDGFFQILSEPKKRNGAFRIAVAVNSEDEDLSWARAIKALGGEVFTLGKTGKKAEGEDDDSDAGGDDDEEGALALADPTEGFMRVAYTRRPNGQYVELVRPVSSEEHAAGIYSTCDALVIVDAVDDIEFLKAEIESVEGEEKARFPDLKIPVLFLSAKNETATADTNGAIPEKLFTPSAVSYQVLAKGNEESAGESLLNWLVSNSPNSTRGTAQVQPSTAWDFSYEMKLTVP